MIDIATLLRFHEQVVDRVSPTGSASSGSLERRQISLLVFALYQWFLFLPPFALIYMWRVDSPILHGAFLLALTLELGIVVFIRAGALRLAGNWNTFNLFWLLLVLSCYTGGTVAPAAVWLVSVPLIGAALGDYRSGIAWALVVVLALATLVGIEALTPFRFPDLLDPLTRSVLMTTSVIALLAFLFQVSAQQKHLQDWLAEQVRSEHDDLSAIVAAAPDAVFALDSMGRVEHCSDAAARVFGYAPRQLCGAPISQLVPALGGDALPDLSSRLPAAHDHTGVRSDGEQFPVALTIQCYGENQNIRYVVITRDVTRERNLENQLRQSQKMEAIGRLTGGIAHDFNNLLSIIAGNAAFLSPAVDHDPQARDDLAVVLGAVDRGASLVQQMLAFSRRRDEEPELIDLSAAIEHAGAMLRRTLGGSIELEVSTTSEPCSALIHPTQFEQVIFNMAINARDAMPDGGRLILRTSTQTETSDRRVVRWAIVEVSDTGVGMDSQTMEQIFEPFFTTSEVGERAGFGLATAHGAVRDAGGTIEVQSEVGVGTTFRIRLPFVEPDDTESPIRPDAYEHRSV